MLLRVRSCGRIVLGVICYSHGSQALLYGKVVIGRIRQGCPERICVLFGGPLGKVVLDVSRIYFPDQKFAGVRFADCLHP